MRACKVCHGDYTGAYMRCQACGRLSRENGMAVAAGIGMLVLWSRAPVITRKHENGELGFTAVFTGGVRSEFLPTEGMALRSLWEKLRHPLMTLREFAKAIGYDFPESLWSLQYTGKLIPVPKPKRERPKGFKCRFVVDDVLVHGAYHPTVEPADVVNVKPWAHSEGAVDGRLLALRHLRFFRASRSLLSSTTAEYRNRADASQRCNDMRLAVVLGLPPFDSDLDWLAFLRGEQVRAR